MRNIAEISYILEVQQHPLCEMDGIVGHVLPVYAQRLVGKTFAVRCKRTGKHSFRSIDVERQLGGQLLAQTEAAGVKLKKPDVIGELEISEENLFVIQRRYLGLGGFAIGSVGSVL